MGGVGVGGGVGWEQMSRRCLPWLPCHMATGGVAIPALLWGRVVGRVTRHQESDGTPLACPEECRCAAHCPCS